jgi:hypothetical protein
MVEVSNGRQDPEVLLAGSSAAIPSLPIVKHIAFAQIQLANPDRIFHTLVPSALELLQQ